jgi:pterin-4a-carbinolamine dehydratase
MNAPTSEAPASLVEAQQAARAPLGWVRRERPRRLECRVEFSDYQATRDFLEQAGALSEAMDLYPNLSFGRTYANLTLFAEEESGELPGAAFTFAERVNALLAPPAGDQA